MVSACRVLHEQADLTETMRWAWRHVLVEARARVCWRLPLSASRLPVFTQKPPSSQAMTVTVYSKPACVQCTATTRALDAKGIAYSVVDLTQDAVALAEVTALGYRQAPVVIAGDAHWTGFRPDMIGRLAA